MTWTGPGGTLAPVKLARFELVRDPGVIRSGVWHQDRVYETDGEKAAGIHEPGDIVLHPPIGRPPCLRLFEAESPEGSAYAFGNPGSLWGPGSEIPSPMEGPGLGMECRIAAVCSDAGRMIDPSEGSSFLLGATLLILFTSEPTRMSELSLGQAPGASRDLGGALGPFLVTPDDLGAPPGRPSSVRFRLEYEVHVNGDLIGEGEWETDPSFGSLAQAASQGCGIYPSDVIAWPPLPLPPLLASALGRDLASGDRIRFSAEPLGQLVIRLG
jgi:2-keto-4-pentenoate hydratase/2-oxohepta-3-ene-1,7-dioic acid hydratase in catechol pathway